ncbi:bifunctional metallophosphatase/5'-nucleotidase [Bacillus pseudomycoides]|uniref:Bifunctional metallophosphatase/5'-nucleotidase n=1 Tax=Bacillus pseudomycoides TaxID=64104 RepID=A0AA91V8K1_9BACI|nr:MULTISPECIES: bifunctional UDP-sugar hydrolase/5'-nucleotidase [Bacillus]PEB51215.1 bifunctional metallophosphatase/5'-nucleotidase [Bacillus sp. AFS098217]PED80578.1 bifunctional metallophosphatase/5'-nucleotidase [Bacillus pseudomycoides]PEU17206.1 bifunctional metallophosphatase/5'-nucleotidase [Bacillus sp. AFS014408]PEU17353.1 bifunctional metallophosphatase/5'-nucleotidase [Bacillus sp. AFS019443]PFW63867.1 bifunctional metallophosphatase/5'-nucleotidase [Bacillus sp. AFS075034]
MHLYHTNDIHSHFENWPQISRFVLEEKKRRQEAGESVLTLDIGDHVDRFHRITEATNGLGNTKLLNEALYDYVTIGNNEGITLAKEHLNHLYDNAGFEILVANLFEKEGVRPTWAKPYKLHTTADGITIALIGLTVAYPAFYKMLDWYIEDPMMHLESILEEVKDKAHITVVLSHLGKSTDEYMAENYDIDVILGAHTHHLFERGVLVNGTLLCCCEKWGHYVGHVQLTVDKETKQLLNKDGRAIKTERLSAYGEPLSTIAMLQEESNLIMAEPVIDLKESLPIHWFQETQFSSMLAGALKKWCNAEIGMVNAGVLLEGMEEGIVTRGDIHRICPHPINPCALKVPGKTLREVILKASRPHMEQLEVKGFGFRGKVMGKMIYDGVEVIPDTIPGNKMLLEEVIINGEPLELNRIYTVGTIDMFTFGYLYPELSTISEKQYYMPELLRDVLTEMLITYTSSIKL